MKHSLCVVSQNQVLEEPTVAVAPVPGIPPEGTSARIRDDRSHPFILDIDIVEAIPQPVEQTVRHGLR